ncbi:MAG: hypothetical protein M3071_11175 [Actinomycetota bacterium]|nr:hypothetical protein [Actinomycetota bacterium]
MRQESTPLIRRKRDARFHELRAAGCALAAQIRPLLWVDQPEKQQRRAGVSVGDEQE